MGSRGMGCGLLGSRRVRRSGFCLAVLMVGSLISLHPTQTVHGHFPFRPHCYVRPVCPPPVAWTPGIWGGGYCPPATSVSFYGTGIWGTSFHRAFYPIHGGCWPSYSFYSCPPVVVAPVCYRPLYHRPVIYRPVIYTPVCNDPFLCDPVVTQWSVARSAPVVPSAITNAGTLLARRTQATSVQQFVQSSVPAGTRVAPQRSSSTLTTYSPVWTDSAIGLIDEMMERGEWELAQQSLERMEKIKTPLSHRVVLRQAVMDLVTHRDEIDLARMDRVMDLLNKAADAGSPFSHEEFRGASLSKYLQASGIELNSILDQLAQRVLQQPDRSGREMMLLSVLLKLDGQQERSLLFAKESRTLAARSDAFRWKSVLRSLDRQIDNDALLATKD